ncbi:hypothetical protein MOQ_002015 [Trypanosoma cruzi marinkellei]|uniref:SAM domain-containing protein n=1 Tax=Trypanosoma cruzi marinkellei TaxID=85056 RepID=K2MR47_TRYCR|nr:hypothetical protein MOQ_002015 [Trypanosoma cruzi marinkellei]
MTHMTELLEEKCACMEEFAASAIPTVLLLWCGRTDDAAVAHGSHLDVVHQSILLYLLRTLDGMCGSDVECVGQTESALKLRLLLWISFKALYFEPPGGGHEFPGEWRSEVLRDSKAAERILASEIFLGNRGAVDEQEVEVLSWLVVEVLLQYRNYWKHVDVWGSLEGCRTHPFILWAVLKLNEVGTEGTHPWTLSCVQQRAVEMIVLLGADAVLIESNRELFTDAYLRTLIAAGREISTPELFGELTSSIRDGLIRGDRLYHDDLCVLLETLRRHVSVDTSERRVHELRTVIDVLLNTACPFSCEKEVMRGVEAVCAWFELLGLQEDYRHVLMEGAIDGEVLRSGLSLHELQQMGIRNEMDAAFLLRVLAARPHRRVMPGDS